MASFWAAMVKVTQVKLEGETTAVLYRARSRVSTERIVCVSLAQDLHVTSLRLLVTVGKSFALAECEHTTCSLCSPRSLCLIELAHTKRMHTQFLELRHWFGCVDECKTWRCCPAAMESKRSSGTLKLPRL